MIQMSSTTSSRGWRHFAAPPIMQNGCCLAPCHTQAAAAATAATLLHNPALTAAWQPVDYTVPRRGGANNNLTQSSSSSSSSSNSRPLEARQHLIDNSRGHRLAIVLLAACVLLACSLLQCSAAQATLVQPRDSVHSPPINIHTVRRQRAEDKKLAWEKEHAALPQRPRRSVCDAGGSCYYSGVQGSLQEGFGLVFCRDCPDPHRQGSHMETWESFQCPAGFHIDAEVVYAVPNDGSSEILNTVGGAIVIVERGEVPFVDKVRNVQNAGGAAVIIIDDGSCTETFECGGWLGSRAEGPLARRDAREAWEGIYIPSVLITHAQAQRLIGLLQLVTMDMPGFGTQVYVE